MKNRIEPPSYASTAYVFFGQMVYPPALRQKISRTPMQRGLFTVGALENLDHNPSSTASQSSFHGTGISMF